ncbi:MAG: hypothetical protein EHM19_03430, partial [Candidatus Latescibacterota bacterium]
PFAAAAVGIGLLALMGEGLLLLVGIGPTRGRIADRLLASFGAGIVVVANGSLLLAVAGTKASAPLLAVPLLLVPAGMVFRRRKREPRRAGARSAGQGAPSEGRSTGTAGRRRPLLSIAAWSLALLQVLGALYHATARPIHAWDAWRIWSFRAKVIFLEGRFPEDFFASDWAGFPGYPLGIPFVEAYLARGIGAWHEPAVKMVFPFFLAGLFYATWSILRETSTRRAADVGLVLLASAPLLVYHGSIAYMDLPLAFFLAAATLHVVRWEKTGDARSLALAALHAGFLPQIKNEGLPLALVLAAIVFYRGARARSLGPTVRRWLLFALPACLLWLLFKYGAGVPESPYHLAVLPGAEGLASRVSLLARSALSMMFFTGSWGIAWFAILFLVPPGWAARAGTPAALLAGGALVFASAYLFTGSFVFLEDGTALGRTLLVLLPLTIAAGLAALDGPARETGR